MNIQNLLKKLSDYPQENKKEIAVKQPYKIKTSESFGTFNSIADYNDTSFALQDNFTPHRKKHLITNYSNLQEELSQIDKMKQVYEKKQHRRERSHNRSIDRSSAGRSSQKHLLKPSNTPSFNKVYKLPAKAKETHDSAIRNIQKEDEKKEERKSSFSYMYPKSPESLEQNDQIEPYEESSLNFESQKDEDHDIFNEQFQIPNKIKAIPIEPLQIEPLQKELKQKCDCEEQLYSFMEKTESRFEYTLNKLKDLEKQNMLLTQKFQKINQINSKYKEAIDSLLDEKERIQEQRQIEKQQKEQLQSLLKDVLYRREREKLQNSKENTHRENDRKGRVQSDHSKSQHHKSTQSKMKVQNLLQKLHIKVDRS